MDMKKLSISKDAYEEISQAEKITKDKRTAKKLRVLLLRFSGKSGAKTAEMVGLSESQVSRIVNEYLKKGLEEFVRQKYGGNHRLLSEDEEQEILKEFINKAMSGQVITVQEIKQAFDKRIGKETTTSYIYALLERHKWRKVMPRSRHPKKASDETIAASKKLTIK